MGMLVAALRKLPFKCPSVEKQLQARAENITKII